MTHPSPSDPVGVLVMAHGTPARPEDVEAFYTRIRRGRPPTPEQLADLVRRYEAIGGTSPLAARTASQVAGLTAQLDRDQPGRYLVRFGAKHTDPSIEEAAADLAATGVGQVVGLVLTPHRSSLGSGEYLERAAAALARSPHPPAFLAVEQWYDTPGFAELMAERVQRASDEVRARLAGGAKSGLVFTAHSLPERAVAAAGDPYPEQVSASAALVARAARCTDWRVAYQSAGRTPDPWMGPDLLDALRALPGEGCQGVVVCPIGFVSDHLEVLYDVDIEARAVAEGAGLVFGRTASLNDDPRFISLLATVVRQAAGGPAAATRLEAGA